MRGVFSRNNQSGIIITDLEIPLDVIEISLQSSGIVDIPKYFFMKFFLLESLNLQNNNITSLPDLPPSLSYLNMSYNKLTEFVLDAVGNQRLEVLDLKYNLMPNYPTIYNTPLGLIIEYRGNDKEYDKVHELKLDFFAQMALDRKNDAARMKKKAEMRAERHRADVIGAPVPGPDAEDEHEMGRDRVDHKENLIQAINVHQSAIRSNTDASIEYLMSTINPEDEKFKYDYMYRQGILNVYKAIVKSDDKVQTTEDLNEEEVVVDGSRCLFCRRLFGTKPVAKPVTKPVTKPVAKPVTAEHLILISNYIDIFDRYDELTTTVMYNYTRDRGCTMSQILERIWTLAKNSSEEDMKSIVCNLMVQMLDGEDVCFVGKYTRVVSSLVSFDKNIKLEISFPIRFGNAVDFFKKNGTYTKKNLIRFVNDSELGPNDKHIWIENINNSFE